MVIAESPSDTDQSQRSRRRLTAILLSLLALILVVILVLLLVSAFSRHQKMTGDLVSISDDNARLEWIQDPCLFVPCRDRIVRIRLCPGERYGRRAGRWPGFPLSSDKSRPGSSTRSDTSSQRENRGPCRRSAVISIGRSAGSRRAHCNPVPASCRASMLQPRSTSRSRRRPSPTLPLTRTESPHPPRSHSLRCPLVPHSPWFLDVGLAILDNVLNRISRVCNGRWTAQVNSCMVLNIGNQQRRVAYLAVNSFDKGSDLMAVTQ